MPFGPRYTASLAESFSSITTTASQPCASSAGEANDCAPAALSGFVFAASRFHTPTSCPTAINRCAMDDPIRPVPHTPIFMCLTSTGPKLGSMENAEILRNKRFVAENVGRAAGEYAASGIEDHRLIRNLQRKMAVLLHQHD